MKEGKFHVSANGLLPNHYEPVGVPKNEPREEEIAAATTWLRACCQPRKTFNTRHGSYQLKHIAERWCPPGPRIDPSGRSWNGQYISNGALIVACLREDYRLKAHGVNAYFNIGQKTPWYQRAR